MTTSHIEHHLIAAQKCVDASLDLIDALPETDSVVRVRSLLEYQYDILNCLILNRHFGSDELDNIIQDCHNITKELKQ